MEEMIRRTINPKKSSIRKELEVFVTSTNTVLKDVVQNMSLIILLRNCHPIYRATYARTLYDMEILSKEEVSEFTKIL